MSARSTKHILETYWDGTLPIDVEALAKKVGADVIYETANKLGRESGYIELINGKPVITISSDEPEVRQRFTLAHEIGHFALNHLSAENPRMPRDNPDSFSSKNKDPREREANQFAIDLLIPANILRFVFYKEGIMNISGIAQKFGVSEVAASYRLKNLGYM